MFVKSHFGGIKMSYKNELVFVEKLLKNFRVNLRYITNELLNDSNSSNSMGLQSILNYEFSGEDLFQLIDSQCKPNTFYRIKNVLLCQYILFRLPDTNAPTFAYIGPYALEPIGRQDIMRIAEHYHVAPSNLTQLEQFYFSIPIISDENALLSLIYTLGEYLWGDYDNFSVTDNLDLPNSLPSNIVPLPDINNPEEALLSAQLLEDRYAVENQLIQAVSSGKLHKAELFFTNMSSHQFERRADNPIRDLKNYAIILNTLLRKAVESAAVHPLQINNISSQYAHKIELISSQSGFMSLIKEMVRKYTLLVKNHSLKGYSMLIRKVITAINSDLTEDLTLNTQAKALNVNPSYLSTLFKKETGSTLTDYVNHKRIEHAILLLNSTDMQIQTIALYCGIPDVNYFTKTFKKIVGKTPKEYREMIMTH